MAITFKKLNHTYSPDMPYSFHALKDIDLEIEEKKITAIIGHTGSGKSTLVQHMNALLLPTSGEVEVAGFSVTADKKPKNLKQLRQKVGLVFQFSEYQLFEETILKDVSFGPKNFGVSEEEAVKRARAALKVVGLDASYENRSPLDLSGGQKRRVAIAGILAMDPEIIVLDEPTAGLDPHGSREMIKLFSTLNKEQGKTIILISHDNEIVYRYADNTVILNKGEVSYSGPTKELFENDELVEKFDLVLPQLLELKSQLQKKGFSLKKHYDDLEALVKDVAKEVKR